jgi:hypothetical protein
MHTNDTIAVVSRVILYFGGGALDVRPGAKYIDRPSDQLSTITASFDGHPADEIPIHRPHQATEKFRFIVKLREHNF